MLSKPHYEVYSLSTSSSLLSTELIFIFDSRAERFTPSLKFLYHESASLPSFRSPSIPLPTLTQTSAPSNLEYLGYIRGKSRMKEARALAKGVQKSIEQPFKKFTNDVIRIWIRKRLLRWERRRMPCEVDESILDEETFKTRDKKGGLSRYAEGMMREGKDGDDDSSSSSSSSSSLASSSPSQYSLGRSTRESHRRLSRARTTHHPSSSTDSWAQNSSSKRVSVSISLSATSTPRHKSSSRSRSRAPLFSYHDQNSDHDSGIGMSEDDFNPDDDDDAKSWISSSSINPGSSISHSDRSYSSSHSSPPHSSHRAHPKKEVSPRISDLDDQLEQEEAIRRRIFADKKAKYRNSSSSSQHPPPSSSGSGSQSRRSQTPTQAFHTPRFNNPFRLSVVGEAKPDPWVGR
ncbi:hypothetical protein BCON_0008g00640 [Botryotinia convoluta]|uniref:Uncharacterized protein n=1 Tax=Botryotinia convoluta TaxID=54673 RepID=A0A4Z1J5S6_9HELO|nr:hypothetical protein BCON_0008g00640 [Botryotinia convoluta]